MPLLVCRIDCFSEMASSAFGEKMKEQVEERLRFYDEGIAPMKNITAMQVSHNLAELRHMCRPITILALPCKPCAMQSCACSASYCLIRTLHSAYSLLPHKLILACAQMSPECVFGKALQTVDVWVQRLRYMLLSLELFFVCLHQASSLPMLSQKTVAYRETQGGGGGFEMMGPVDNRDSALPIVTIVCLRT